MNFLKAIFKNSSPLSVSLLIALVDPEMAEGLEAEARDLHDRAVVEGSWALEVRFKDFSGGNFVVGS